jgi:hypothetical protein
MGGLARAIAEHFARSSSLSVLQIRNNRCPFQTKMGVGRDQEKHPTFSLPSATFCEGKFQKQRIPSTSWSA